jgi:hypothetical protein
MGSPARAGSPAGWVRRPRRGRTGGVRSPGRRAARRPRATAAPPSPASCANGSPPGSRYSRHRRTICVRSPSRIGSPHTRSTPRFARSGCVTTPRGTLSIRSPRRGTHLLDPGHSASALPRTAQAGRTAAGDHSRPAPPRRHRRPGGQRPHGDGLQDAAALHAPDQRMANSRHHRSPADIHSSVRHVSTADAAGSTVVPSSGKPGPVRRRTACAQSLPLSNKSRTTARVGNHGL